MSADNYWFVTRHPEGGFTYVMGFASDEERPDVYERYLSRLPRFEFLSQAASAAARDGYTEYGVEIDKRLLRDSGLLELPAVIDVVDVLRRLAPEDPMNQDELGGCVWCGGNGSNGSYGYDGPDFSEHSGDCAWVAGRRLLDSLRP